MSALPANLIDLMFGGMQKLGPGSDDETLHVLQVLPHRSFSVVVDAGCGTGRQTRVLARELGRPVDAVDLHEPFLRDLARRAAAEGLSSLIRTHCMDMKDIPSVFPRVDLLWAEGSAYSIGFTHALELWAPVIIPGGFLVASELCWLREDPPAGVRDFFSSGYPNMRSAGQTAAAAESAGYTILKTRTLSPTSWIDGYYEVLEPRALSLINHSDEAVRNFSTEMLREIEVFRNSGGSYGYIFFVLQRA